MTATPLSLGSASNYYSPITSFVKDKSEFLKAITPPYGNSSNYSPEFIANTNNKNTSITMARSCSVAHSKAPAVLMSDIKRIQRKDSSPTASLSSNSGSSGSNSSNSSMSGRYLANAIAMANENPTGSSVGYNERASIETPFNKIPYVVEEQEEQKQQRLVSKSEPYVRKGTNQELSQWKAQNEQPQLLQNSELIAIAIAPKEQRRQHQNQQQHRGKKNPRRASQRIPRITAASVPFEKTIPPTSFLRDELCKDPAYRHSLKAGTLWQSLVGQHVKLPALWFDGEEPARPYLGCEDPLKRNKWSYFGRHRVAGDQKLNSLVKNSLSSGKLLLHIICKDSQTFEPTEDIVVGVFHPNAEGVCEQNQNCAPDHQRHEDYRDVWIGHRSRRIPHNGRRIATRIESLLRYLHKNKVDKSPLGEDHRKNAKSKVAAASSKKDVDNNNINAVFGSRAPRHTIFVPEETLHGLLLPKSTPNAPSPPPSVVLLRAFLR